MDRPSASLRLNRGFREIGCPVWRILRRTFAFGRHKGKLLCTCQPAPVFVLRRHMQVYIQNNRLVSLAGLKTFKFLRVSVVWPFSRDHTLSLGRCCWLVGINFEISISS